MNDGRRMHWIVIGAAGVFALVAQSLLFRRFFTVFEGNELGVAWFFTTWLAWVAAGAALGRIRARWPDRLAARFELLVLLYPLAFLLQDALTRHARLLSGVAAYEVFPLARMLPVSLLANAPVSFLTGLFFALACRWAASAGRVPVSAAYVSEAAGSCAGGVAVTLLLWRGAAAESIFLGAAALLVLACGLYHVRGRGARLAAVPLLLAACALAAVWGGARQRAVDRSAWARLLPPDAYRGSFRTPQAAYHYGMRRGQFTVVARESPAASVPNTEHASAVAALHLAQCPDARRFLVVGADGYALCRQLLRLPQTESVTWLAPDPGFPGRLLDVLPERLAVEDERLHVPDQDIRTVLDRSGAAWDLAILALPDATTLALNRYLTCEFFARLATRLAPGGVVGVRVAGGDNVLGDELVNVGSSAYRTLRTVFAGVAIKPGDETWLLASDGDGLSASPAVLRDRFRRIPGAAELYPPDGLLSLYLPDRMAFQREKYRAAAATAGNLLVNTDARPRALFHALLHTAREAGLPRAATAALRNLAARGRLLIPLALLLYGVLRTVYLRRSAPRRRLSAAAPVPANSPGMTAGRDGLSSRAPSRDLSAGTAFDAYVLVAFAGAAAMAFSIVLMLLYQAMYGSIFLYVGLIAALFMLGLVLGGLAAARYTARRGMPPRAGITALVGLHAVLVAGVAALPAAAPRAVFPVLFVLSGIAGGMYVPLAAARLAAAGVTERAAGGGLELSDHLGGAWGGLVTGLVLVPVFGTGTALGVASLVLLINLAPLFAGGTGGSRSPGPAAWRRRAGYLLVGAAVWMLAAAHMVHRAAAPPPSRRFAAVAHGMAGTNTAEAKRATFADGRAATYYEVAAPTNAYIFSTGDFAPRVIGYGGPLALAVMMDANGVVRACRILESRETPAYLARVVPWLARLAGRDMTDPDPLRGLDAVSGATMTCEAVQEALTLGAAGFRREVLHRAGEPASAGRRAGGGTAPALIVLALLTAAALVLRRRPHPRLRRLWLLLVTVLLGFVWNVQYSLAQVLELLGPDAPAPGWTVTFALTVALPLLTLLAGNLYCGYLCPFGALQELVGGLRPRRLRTAPDRAGWAAARGLKFLVLFAAVAVFAVLFEPGVSSADPLVAVFSAGRSAPVAVLAVVLLALAFFYPRFWCRALCPAGAFLALLNGLRLLRRFLPRIAPGRCPYGVQAVQEVDCIQCDRCRMPDARRPKAGGARGPRLLFWGCAVLVALILLWRMFPRAPAAPPPAAGMTHGARAADAARLRRLIEAGRLSGREAMYYEAAEPP